jgi:hypothetical protein
VASMIRARPWAKAFARFGDTFVGASWFPAPPQSYLQVIAKFLGYLDATHAPGSRQRWLVSYLPSHDAQTTSGGTTMLGQPQKHDYSDFRKNSLLAALEPGDYEALLREATVVTLKLGKRLYRQGDHVNAVHFPLTCTVSLLLTIEGGAPMEMAMVGKEGVVGSPEVIHALRAIGSRVAATWACRATRRGCLPGSVD